MNPPGAAIERPSIALGVLQSVLAAAGIESRIRYVNMWFADYVGPETVQYLTYFYPSHGVFDWLFTQAAFPDDELRALDYLDHLRAKHQALAKRFSSAVLLEMRERAVAFVADAALKILAERPLIVGCTSTFCQHTAALALLRRIRFLAPEVVTMMGGANCESVMGQTTHRLFPWVDYVVSGEAEDLIVNLVNDIRSFGREVPVERLAHGVFSPNHRRNGYPTASNGDGAPRAKVQLMSVVPPPDYKDFFREMQQTSFHARVRPGLPIEASRGCWWGERAHCLFCGLNGGAMNFRSKTAGAVLAELSAAGAAYGIKSFEFVDNILDPLYFETLFPALIRLGAPYEIFFEVKANLRRGEVETLAKAGVRWVQPGIESLDARILKLMRKGCTPGQNLALLKWCRERGIRVFWNIIFGTPGEKDDWYADQAVLLPLVTHLEPPNPVQLQFCRYSPYFTQPKDHGVELVPSRAYRHLYPAGADDLERIAYYFDNRQPDSSSTPAETPGLVRMMIALGQWRLRWDQAEPPRCHLESKSGEVVVVDTRMGATESIVPIGLIAQDLLVAADATIAREKLEGIGTAKGWSVAAVRESIDWLCERAFLLEFGGSLLSIVLREHPPMLPHPDHFPGGSFSEME